MLNVEWYLAFFAALVLSGALLGSYRAGFLKGSARKKHVVRLACVGLLIVSLLFVLPLTPLYVYILIEHFMNGGDDGVSLAYTKFTFVPPPRPHDVFRHPFGMCMLAIMMSFASVERLAHGYDARTGMSMTEVQAAFGTEPSRISIRPQETGDIRVEEYRLKLHSVEVCYGEDERVQAVDWDMDVD